MILLFSYIQSLFSVVTSFPESADYIKMVYTIITNLHGKLTDISTGKYICTFFIYVSYFFK